MRRAQNTPLRCKWFGHKWVVRKEFASLRDTEVYFWIIRCKRCGTVKENGGGI